MIDIVRLCQIQSPFGLIFLLKVSWLLGFVRELRNFGNPIECVQ